ncbi:hypothetical protein [Sulfurimonas sp.]|uniref:hypothetical protein n=1 Tax=Sulfurimonas sp. TaxID=2022749 RepID=UPI003565E63F
MRYFSKVKLKQEVFSLIYGKGRVVFALPKEHRLDGFYVFAVEYNNNQKVHYTIDGVPNWTHLDGGCQTVFYLQDIDLSDIDIQPPHKVPSEKQILKYKEKGTLEIQCPSGIWRNVDECPEELMKKAFKKSRYYLFRKQKDNH